MRISDRRLRPILGLLLAAGCHRAGENKLVVAPSDPAGILCAPAGATGFARVCRVERAASTRGELLTVQKPDGGFRRLLVLPGGRGLVAADGAEPARLERAGPATIEVAIGGDRFRLPARLPHS